MLLVTMPLSQRARSFPVSASWARLLRSQRPQPESSSANSERKFPRSETDGLASLWTSGGAISDGLIIQGEMAQHHCTTPLMTWQRKVKQHEPCSHLCYFLSRGPEETNCHHSGRRHRKRSDSPGCQRHCRQRCRSRNCSVRLGRGPLSCGWSYGAARRLCHAGARLRCHSGGGVW